MSLKGEERAGWWSFQPNMFHERVKATLTIRTLLVTEFDYFTIPLCLVSAIRADLQMTSRH